jgi:glycosyltransferase involved in cell wall biosynthesis
VRILHVHEHYQQPGGEDQAFARENALLEAAGHSLVRYSVHNDQIRDMGRLRLAQATVWNQAVYRELRDLIRRERPALAAFQNTLPLISPAAYYAASSEGVPVVQTLHNYRLLCPSGLLFREGRVCEDCVGKTVAWHGVIHGCYRGSRPASAAVATMLAVHRVLGTWDEQVDLYVALTEFAREKFVAGGIPPERIMVRPHFVHPDPGPGEGKGGYALFVGRLSPEKGLDTLLDAWGRLGGRMPLRIVGDGPLGPLVRATAGRTPGVEWLGRKSVDEVSRLMAEAAFLVFPSKWYETFGLVAIEAFARGTPVIAARIGAIAEVVAHGRTGLHFRPGDPEDLAGQVEWALTHPSELAVMRREARTEFETKYTAKRNYELLMDIYERARAIAGRRL